MSDVFKWLFFYPMVLLFAIIALLLVALGVTEANKAYWDSKVRKWCEEDGGVTVFEKVVLKPEEFKRNDGSASRFINVPNYRSPNAHEYDYVHRTEVVQVIKKSNPSVTKLESVVYRKKDNKVLGKFVDYRRSGGDLFYISLGPATSSGFSCRRIKNIDKDLVKNILSLHGE